MGVGMGVGVGVYVGMSEVPNVDIRPVAVSDEGKWVVINRGPTGRLCRGHLSHCSFDDRCVHIISDQ